MVLRVLKNKGMMSASSYVKIDPQVFIAFFVSAPICGEQYGEVILWLLGWSTLLVPEL